MITGIQLSIDLEREWQNNAGKCIFQKVIRTNGDILSTKHLRSFILIPMHRSGNYTHIYGFSDFILP
jgi:hypothetical protein